MRIFVSVKPKSKITEVEQVNDTHFVVRVKEPPVEGKANVAVVEALAEYFGVGQSRIRLVSGATSKQKVFEII